MESPSPRNRRRTKQRRLQLEIIIIDSELEHISRLHPDTRQAIDRARDLLGRYSHSINGIVNVREFCGRPEKHARSGVAL